MKSHEGSASTAYVFMTDALEAIKSRIPAGNPERDETEIDSDEDDRKILRWRWSQR
jgi:hypothetical protein